MNRIIPDELPALIEKMKMHIICESDKRSALLSIENMVSKYVSSSDIKTIYGICTAPKINCAKLIKHMFEQCFEPYFKTVTVGDLRIGSGVSDGEFTAKIDVPDGYIVASTGLMEATLLHNSHGVGSWMHITGMMTEHFDVDRKTDFRKPRRCGFEFMDGNEHTRVEFKMRISKDKSMVGISCLSFTGVTIWFYVIPEAMKYLFNRCVSYTYAAIDNLCTSPNVVYKLHGEFHVSAGNMFMY